MAFAREIFVQIKNKIPFKQSEKEKDSHYAYVGNSIVRISNHCTWMYIWDEILEQNPKDKGKPIISLVFEDEGCTFDERCLLLKRFRRNPIKVQEFVFPIHGNGQYISSEDIKYIIESLFAVQQGEIYKDRTGKCEFFQRISKSPEDSGSVPQQQITNENKQYRNTNTTMKQTIKLDESQLRGLIKESIKKVLNENERDIDDDTYFGGGLPDSYYQDPAHERPNEYDNDEPSIPEDISDFIYERLKNLPDKVDRFDAKNLNALDIRLVNVYRELRNHIGDEDSFKYIREYVKYYLPDYETVYNKLRHVVEEAKWLFNENI